MYTGRLGAAVSRAFSEGCSLSLAHSKRSRSRSLLLESSPQKRCITAASGKKAKEEQNVFVRLVIPPMFRVTTATNCYVSLLVGRHQGVYMGTKWERIQTAVHFTAMSRFHWYFWAEETPSPPGVDSKSYTTTRQWREHLI